MVEGWIPASKGGGFRLMAARGPPISSSSSQFPARIRNVRRHR
ncbi:hypothetical protein CASFOL_024537 [Castilleja foliolosa]|uniref:Uncharacterized protein n=1 Tax=Castilleja foliolosa TaxID=1961234 RepID=A0ABD3CNM7_9LAMI